MGDVCKIQGHTRIVEKLQHFVLWTHWCIHEYQTLFQSPHLRDFKNPNDDMYHAPPYKKNSPCEDQEFNKELHNEKVMERDAFLFAVHDIVLHYA